MFDLGTSFTSFPVLNSLCSGLYALGDESIQGQQDTVANITQAKAEDAKL